uniref:Endothelin-converting enzyme 1 n=1 Tax=Panagrolaimus davidi TaxID=227884 RepID=A0A914QEN6_9BILA
MEKNGGKFIRYSIILIIILCVLTIALQITTLIMDAVNGGGPSQDEMCAMMPPGMCGPPPNSTGDPNANPGTNGTVSNSTSPSSVASKQQQMMMMYKLFKPTYDSPEYTQIALQYLSSVNFSADPCEDFYQYACGMWPSQHSAPKSTGSWSEYNLVSQKVSEMVEEAIKSTNLTDASEGLKKAKHFYDNCMDILSIEKDQGTKLGNLLHTGIPEDSTLYGFEDGTGKWALIDKAYSNTSSLSLETQIARLKSHFGIDTFFLPYAIQYSLNSEETILWLTPTMLPLGMGMFQHPYYLKPDKKNVRVAYQQLQKDIALLLAADSDFGNVVIKDEDLQGMLNLEIQLANLTYGYSYDVEIQQHRNPRKKIKRDSFFSENDRLWTLKEINDNIPGFNWNDYLQNLVSPDLWDKLSKQNQSLLYVDFPKYYISLIDLLNKSQPRDIRNYAIWRLVKYSIPFMSSKYTEALAKFNAVLQGRTITPPSQSSICLSYIRGNYEMPNLGFATAEAIIKQGYFSESAKAKAVEMVSEVKNGLLDLIKGSTWMDTETKQNAIHKATLMDASIAYPKWILNKTAQKIYYQDLQIPTTSSFISLNLMLRGWAVEKQLSQIGVPLDRSDFPGTPLQTDAWYTESTNSLTAPLGELQPPFFGLNYPDAVNFGGAGAVLGHEMSHGFDKNGADYDAYGNATNWWSNSSKAAFNNHCNCLINQFNKYCYGGIGCVNGNQTIDENVADLAGLKAAYKAYKSQSKPQFRLTKAPMFSSDQLFFLSFASFWCGSETPAAIEQQIQTDVHTPLKYRVIGTVRNMPEFAEAFQCSKNSFMNPTDRCTIW